MSGGSLISGAMGGVLFGLGLSIAGMTDPSKVLAFLTLGSAWDPTLVFVLGSAVTTTAIGYRLVDRRQRPIFENVFHRPERTDLDARLIGGGALFGLGGGLAGFCPGPAIVAALTLDSRAWVCGAAMAAGMLLFNALPSARSPQPTG